MSDAPSLVAVIWNIKPFDPLAWYWFVAGDRTRAFSSAAMAYVRNDDPDFMAWQQSGGLVTHIISADELSDVMIQQAAPPILLRGINVTAPDAPHLDGDYALDQQQQVYINSVRSGIATDQGLPGGGETFDYAGHAFTAEEFVAFATLAGHYTYDVSVSIRQIVTTGEGEMPSRDVTLEAAPPDP